MRRSLGSLIAFFVLATTAPTRAGLFTSDWEEARDKASACFAAIDKDPSLAEINARSVRSKPTLAQLADDTYPTDSDIEQLRRREDAGRVCRDIYLTATQKEYPSLGSALALRYYQTDLVLLQLLEHRITFANANRLAQQAYLQYRLHADMYFEIQSDRQRQAMADSLDSFQKQLNEGAKPTGPRPVTCAWMGPMLKCTEQ
ncbi:MAG: hypothetical protein K8S25_12925 [Alphaproteobacteria bacterium]|nr:hypothetical protein [Alphaproteobacteria bacterium]